MIDPIKLSKAIKKTFMKKVGDTFLAPYWRFRGGKWYGGIATADIIGCNICCKFCGPRLFMLSRRRHYKYKTPQEVARILTGIARKRGYRYIRISGGEPTIYWEHLLQVLDNVKHEKFTFILETNGILIGANKEFAEELSQYPNIHVRVSLKGTNEEEFANLTMADRKFFFYQLQALKNLLNSGVSFHPAVVASFSPVENIQKLEERLSKIDPKLAEALEIEYIVLYPHVIRNLKRYRLVPLRAYTTDFELIDEEEFKRRFL